MFSSSVMFLVFEQNVFYVHAQFNARPVWKVGLKKGEM